MYTEAMNMYSVHGQTCSQGLSYSYPPEAREGWKMRDPKNKAAARHEYLHTIKFWT